MANAGQADPPLTLPKKSRLVLVESTPDSLEIRSRSEFSWIYLGTMVCLVGAFVGVEIIDKPAVEPGAVAFGAILFGVFVAFTAFQSTYQWLRVENGHMKYQLRLWSVPLTRKESRLADITKLSTDDVDTESSGSVWAVITTRRWEVRFGFACEIDPAVIDMLLRELRRLQTRAGRA